MAAGDVGGCGNAIAAAGAGQWYLPSFVKELKGSPEVEGKNGKHP